MSDNAKNSLAQINEKLKQLPESEVAGALSQYAARMEGYADGFVAGAAYARKEE